MKAKDLKIGDRVDRVSKNGLGPIRETITSSSLYRYLNDPFWENTKFIMVRRRKGTKQTLPEKEIVYVKVYQGLRQIRLAPLQQTLTPGDPTNFDGCTRLGVIKLENVNNKLVITQVE